jgi:DNA-directed RNA polymerase specialized sigma24 family protein
MKLLRIAKYTVSRFTLPPSVEFEDCTQELVKKALEKGIADKPAHYLFKAFRNMMINMLESDRVRWHDTFESAVCDDCYGLIELLMPVEGDTETLLAVVMNDGVVSSAADMMGVSVSTMFRKWNMALTHLRNVHGNLSM